MKEIPSNIVRLGHLHESGKVAGDFIDAVEARIRKRFRFVPVKEMPPAWDTWLAQAKHILEAPRAALDLSPAQEVFIVAIDNCCWGDEDLIHYCLGLLCLAQCGGTHGGALKLMITATVLSVGRAAPSRVRGMKLEA